MRDFLDQPIFKLAYRSVILGFSGCVVFGSITAVPAIFLGHKSLGRIKSGPSELSDIERRLSKSDGKGVLNSVKKALEIGETILNFTPYGGIAKIAGAVGRGLFKIFRK